MSRVLIIDDDRMMNEALSSVVERMGHEVRNAFTLREGLDKALAEPFDVIFLDVRMPDGSGLAILPRLRETESSPEVIIITGYGDPDGAELAIRNGAWDYIQKPASMQTMTLPLIRALQYRQEKNHARPPVLLKREGIIGESPKMKATLERLAQIAAAGANVLITGETGTGKELFAKAIHENSPRAGKKFIVVDCTALPETLVESLLFGHEKGAFTGAVSAREGLIKQADGGTLFLDEVGELPLAIQKSFLRVLEEHQFRPLGAKKEITSDFRLIAATNRNLDHMVEQGEFRKDLLFRLRSLILDLPPLRERLGDIRELTVYHVNKLCERYGTETKGFSPEFFTVLAQYDWPGNVRELVHTLEQALAVAAYEPTLFPTHLPTHIRIRAAQASVGESANHEKPKSHSLLEAADVQNFPIFKDFRKFHERRYLERLLIITNNSMKESCRLSGLSRTRLYELLKEHEISGDNL